MSFDDAVAANGGQARLSGFWAVIFCFELASGRTSVARGHVSVVTCLAISDDAVTASLCGAASPRPCADIAGVDDAM